MKTGRTVTLLIFLSLLMFLSAVYLVRFGETGVSVFSSLTLGLVGIGATGAGKSATEALATGSGLKGVVAAVMTNQKPPEAT